MLQRRSGTLFQSWKPRLLVLTNIRVKIFQESARPSTVKDSIPLTEIGMAAAPQSALPIQDKEAQLSCPAPATRSAQTEAARSGRSHAHAPYTAVAVESVPEKKHGRKFCFTVEAIDARVVLAAPSAARLDAWLAALRTAVRTIRARPRQPRLVEPNELSSPSEGDPFSPAGGAKRGGALPPLVLVRRLATCERDAACPISTG